MYYRLGRAGRALDRFGVIEFATTIAPGVRDVLLTGKVFEAVAAQQPQQGRHPTTTRWCSTHRPTGRITQFLNVSNELAGLAKVGPIKAQSDTMMTLFRSPRTAVHLVTVLEEMPVQETSDGIAELRASRPARRWRRGQPGPAARPLRRRPRRRPRRHPRPGPRSRADLKAAGVEVDDALVDGLLAEAHDHAERRALEESQRRLVERLDVPSYELPRLPEGIDLGALYELAGLLREQGLA